MIYLARVDEILEEVGAIAAAEGKQTGFCIGNTTKLNATGLYFTPIRNTSCVVAGSAIVYEAHHAAEIARSVDGRVAYILLDAEKKVGPNPSSLTRPTRATSNAPSGTSSGNLPS